MKFKFTIHPLFIVFGLYFALIGRLFEFLICTTVALIHECGHAFCAYSLGYKLNRIMLMPFGALVSGDISGISLKDDIMLSLWGPLTNIICALFFIALWWIFPDLYAYTDTAVYFSATIAAVNLLPAYPLDGGRILYCLLAKNHNAKKAKIICCVISWIFALLLTALFIYSCFYNINLSILFFALFIIFGTIDAKKCDYVKINFSVTEGLKRGLEIKRIAVADNLSIKKIISFLEPSKYLEINVFKEGNYLITLSQDELYSLFEKSTIYEQIGSYIDYNKLKTS
jgi:stage IV sporulation protein FB